MIIFGWNYRLIREAPLESLKCPHCGSERQRIRIKAYYAHLFRLPLIPYKKIAAIECDECKNHIPESSLGDQLKTSIYKLKKSVPYPMSMFVGSGLLVLLVAYITLQYRLNENRYYDYLLNPQVGDVYHLKDKDETSEYRYYLWKAKQLFEDSLYISANAYTYTGVPDELVADDGFYETHYVIDKNTLKELYDAGELVKIQRGYSSDSGFERKLLERPGVHSDTTH